jgi:alpha-galactosidase
MKVTFIGAGSAVFAAEIIKDLLLIKGFEGGTIGLVDIDADRLSMAVKITKALIDRSGGNWKYEASVDRTEILPDTDYVINSIEVAGPQNVEKEYEIPLKYGVDQCIGDTIGPGGLFKALRTLPAWIDILKDVEKLAPGATVLNYTNPMSIAVLAAQRTTQLPVVGLCHSIQQTSRQLATYLDIPYRDLKWTASGINHMAWFVELADKNGNSLYPRLRQAASNPEVLAEDPVRFEIMKQLGAFCTESSGHVSEYLPYFRKRPDIIEAHCGPGYLGESGYYKNNWPIWRNSEAETFAELTDVDVPLERGEEYASYIIEAMEKDEPAVIYGNVPNAGPLIDNLDKNGIVEVACLIDGHGIRPTHFGSLPEQMANFNRVHMAFHSLVVDAVLNKDRETALHALQIDPLTSAVCSLSEIRSLFDELRQAESQWLPEFMNN